MNQAIHYIDPNNLTLVNKIPKQAVNIPLVDTLDKHSLLMGLGQVGEFPDYYAPNWDSLWDCLTDSSLTHLKLNLTGITHIDTEDLNIFIRIINDACEDFGQPQLWIIVAD